MNGALDRYPDEPQGEHADARMERASLGERWWWGGTHVGLAAGLTMAFFTWGLAVSLAAAFAFAILSWIVVMTLDETDRVWPPSHVGACFISGCSAVAVLSGLYVLHWTAAVLLIATLLTSPRLWRSLGVVPARRVRGMRMSRQPAGPGPSDPSPSIPGLRNLFDATVDAALAPQTFSPTTLDDDQLCLAWRSSFVHLQAARSAGEFVRLVERRRELLDELSRRHHAGVSRWLASGARAASNPRRFLDPASLPPGQHP